ncbi:GNAT family N-acetyltransferase [Cohaesibacter sp. CAU 1516]|uniref:GNAT family N-acetyltransferase n=1 Tax=Cohaesibacter sp. CAU 1516 TaxID=2576038 RepID=UPI0018E52EFE|nr:GNAT family N-acetyltransferase [Cohaesibacter sp. CAU 1516]
MIVFQIEIREAQRKDVPAIVSMLIDDVIGKDRENDADLTPYYEAFDAISADANNSIFVACDEVGAVVGTFQLVYMHGLSVMAAKRAEIEAVRIHSYFRGRGLGKQMFAWAMDKAKADGCAILQLTTSKTRGDSQRFYDQLGFEATHIGYKMSL